MMTYRIVATLVVLTATMLPLVSAEQEPKTTLEASGTYKIDPVHTSIWFGINHLGVADFYGRFNEVSGEFTLAKDPAESQLEVIIPVASIDTNNAERDKHLKAAEFFDVEKYPEIRFRSRQFKRTEKQDTFEVKGELTLRGVTRPLVIELRQTGAGEDPWGNFRSGLETTFTIKRSDFGMNAMPKLLGDEVRLMVSVEGLREK